MISTPFLSKPVLSDNEKANSEPVGVRIAKHLAHMGIASRREVERMIEQGRVRVDNCVLKTPAFFVLPHHKISVDNKVLPVFDKQQVPRLWRYHKPAGFITSHKDPQDRPTIFDNLPADLYKENMRVLSVGRLDLTSEGLLLLTNNGGLKRVLELPSTGWVRRYRARAYGHVSQEALDELQDGIMIDGVKTGEIIAKLERQQGDNAWINVSLREGKNREIRRALQTFNLQVSRLIRLSYGPFQLGTLERGQAAEIPYRIIRDQIGHLMELPAISSTPKSNVGRGKMRARPVKRSR